ncbi:Vascular endothelial growth factor A-A [Habropoda laboriosa]|uniref:Vascular endothelial growth factor A-A n=1 Tax=Habropoda laboriosa TaxID=597456 RepID=A0A0L7R7V1_9HYME|nr:Vascular endothelial growth factor A-A [Habropoda laboriosa]
MPPRLIVQKTIALVILCTLAAVAQDTKFHGDSDGIVFPGPINDRSKATKPAVPPVQPAQSRDRDVEMKSLNVARMLNNADSVDEMLKLFGYTEKQPFAIDVRIGGPEERSNAERPQLAKCMPELQTVPLKQEHDPSTIYIPSCTRIMRCGGCCSHELLSCQPTASETRNFEVFVTSIVEFGRVDKRIVPLEEHTSCVCDCKTKKEDCNEKQTYLPDECMCSCKNVDEEEKCYKNNNTKIWNPNQCACFCRQELECSTGFFFDQNTCRCEQKRKS